MSPSTDSSGTLAVLSSLDVETIPCFEHPNVEDSHDEAANENNIRLSMAKYPFNSLKVKMIIFVVVQATVHDEEGSAHWHAGRGIAIEAHVSVGVQ